VRAGGKPTLLDATVIPERADHPIHFAGRIRFPTGRRRSDVCCADSIAGPTRCRHLFADLLLLLCCESAAIPSSTATVFDCDAIPAAPGTDRRGLPTTPFFESPRKLGRAATLEWM